MRAGGAAGLCDTHMHVYGPPGRFPGSGLEPAATFEDYRSLRARLGIARTVYVQPSAYGRDHGCLLDAIERHGADARGVAVAGTEVPASELRRLHAAGIRGVRFHGLIDGCLPLDELEPVARHVAPLGWHVVVQTAGAQLPDLEGRLAALPCDVVIDHMGRIPAAGGLDDPAFRSLLRLMALRHCWLKLSGPYYLSPDDPVHPVGGQRVRALRQVAPERLLWGSNWPHPSLAPDRKPDDAALLAAVAAWCGDDWPAIAGGNAARLYGFPEAGDAASPDAHSHPDSS